MLTWIWRSTTRQGSRWWALFGTLVVAAAAFALLTAQSQASRLDVVQTAEANSRSAYDVLVRPAGSRLALEEERGLVQPGFLDIDGEGISVDQWRQIQDLPGVELAAPIAVVGWVVPTMQVPTDLSGVPVSPEEPTLLRRTATWTYDHGASTVRAAPVLEYLTANSLLVQSDPGGQGSWFVERMPDGQLRKHDLSFETPEVVSDPNRGYDTRCVHVTATCRFGFHTVQVPFPFPFLVVAVDPAAEADLAGLDDAVTSGSYLQDAELDVVDVHDGADQSDLRRIVPVLVADKPTLDLSVDFRIEDLGPQAAADAAAGTLPKESATGTLVDQGTWDAETVYADLFAAMRTPESGGEYYAYSIRDVLRTGPVSYTPGQGETLLASTSPVDPLGWSNRADRAGSPVPPGGDDTSFHDLAGFSSRGDNPAPAVTRVGAFDAESLVGSALTEVPLGTYAFSPPVAADAAATQVLGDTPWLPSANIQGFVQAPPLMVTTLSALPAFTDPAAWEQAGRGGFAIRGRTPVHQTAPLSAVRVRVAGVSGLDAASRERVRLVAQRIATETGLDVDITLGSSPAAQDVVVPPGVHGRPEMTVTQNWVRKGVAVALVSAADRKSLLLNVAILLVSAVVVNNAALASVRARRRQIATLLMTGWTRGAVLRAEMGSLLVVSCAAGVLAAVLALVLGRLGSAPVSPLQAALAVPAAVVVAMLAGSVAAVSAARAPVLDAVRPTGATGYRSVARRVHGIAGMALRAILAAPGRAMVSAAAVAVAVAALGVLLGIQLQFSGQAVGTLLGDAIALQVRGADLAAVAGIVILAGAGVGHAGALEVRERASELVMLRVTGWQGAHLARLILTHGLLLGALGAAVGSALALVFAQQVLEGVTSAILIGTVVAALVGIVVAVLASLTPARALARMPATTILAEE